MQRRMEHTGSRQIHVRRRASPEVVFVVKDKHIAWLPQPAAITPADEASPPARQSPASAADHRLFFVCEAYASGLCPAGTRCPDVHVDVRRAKKLRPHFRVPDAPGPRLGAPGQLVAVARVNERLPSLVVDASQCLPTRASPKSPEASGALERVPSLCAHFTKKGVCDYGADCRFVHCASPPPPASSGRRSATAASASPGGNRPSATPPQQNSTGAPPIAPSLPFPAAPAAAATAPPSSDPSPHNAATQHPPPNALQLSVMTLQSAPEEDPTPVGILPPQRTYSGPVRALRPDGDRHHHPLEHGGGESLVAGDDNRSRRALPPAAANAAGTPHTHHGNNTQGHRSGPTPAQARTVPPHYPHHHHHHHHHQHRSGPFAAAMGATHATNDVAGGTTTNDPAFEHREAVFVPNARLAPATDSWLRPSTGSTTAAPDATMARPHTRYWHDPYAASARGWQSGSSGSEGPSL
mmetsp:Transcript_13188/g.40984  ORF Transcript_13188/g.40984 Transcript_13188/m.40984 type:complete len:467 (-) Transcript_13188:610-2010(-)